MSDHYHYEYAEQRHDHRGEYADDRHDHDLDYAEKHHRHYDDERAVDELRRQLRELREDLRDSLERIRALEDRQPDYADEPDDESWRSTLADYHVASGGAEYVDDLAEAPCGGPEPAWPPVPRLRRRTPGNAETGGEASDAEG